LDVFDTKMASIRSPSILDMVDMAALLFRLEFEVCYTHTRTHAHTKHCPLEH